MATAELRIRSVIGFSGKVRGGLHYTPCGKYIVFPLGSFVVLKNLKTEREAFLDGHTNEINCIAISKDGTRLASGQRNITGVKADGIIWDLAEAKRLLEAGRVMIGESCFLHRLRQHLGEVRDLAFSPRNDYLCTLGGQDDNALVVWHVASGEALCGAPAASESALCCRWLNRRNDRIVTGGYYHVRVWQMDQRSPKLHPIDAKLGTLRRIATCLSITEDDECAYFGTNTGDVVKVKIDRDEIRGYNDPDTIIPTLVGVSKDRLPQGIKSLSCVVNPSTGNTNVLVGAGDGSLQYINPKLCFVAGRSAKLMGGITSIAVHPVVENRFCIGTDQCNRYELNNADLSDPVMKQSCHFGSVNDVAFPEGCSDLIVSSSAGDIRVWNIKLKQELLRIQVPNLECHCCVVTPSGSAIVSGWDDGKVRAFYPETGRMKFVIADAHSERVSAIAIADNDNANNNFGGASQTGASAPNGDRNYKQWRIITGGSEGRVRIWKITSSHQALLSSLKEHRGPVNCIKITPDKTQFVSASSDGSCIVWDLDRYIRLMAFFEPNVFESVLYHPDSSQMLTCGSNHKITYWDASDGQAIRVIDGGDEAMTSLDIEPTGEFFISGGQDKFLKIWHYDEGLPVALGRGHSGTIKAVKVSPDQNLIVSVGSTGEIIFWEMPPVADLRSGLVTEEGGNHGSRK